MDTRQTDTRRHRLTRRSALAGLGAAALVGLTALAGGATATASPRPVVAPSAPAASARLSVADLRWASMPTTSPALRPAAPVRYGSCSASMIDL
jgi:hypothetical protein